MIKDYFADPSGKIQTTSQGLSPIKPRNKIQILFIVIFVISACGSMPTITQTPVHLPPALPDLVVSNVHIASPPIRPIASRLMPLTRYEQSSKTAGMPWRRTFQLLNFHRIMKFRSENCLPVKAWKCSCRLPHPTARTA